MSSQVCRYRKVIHKLELDSPDIITLYNVVCSIPVYNYTHSEKNLSKDYNKPIRPTTFHARRKALQPPDEWALVEFFATVHH